jgi:hypothetical protein
MRRAFRPSAERLEAHVLLSTAAAAPFAVSGSPVVETLSTDKSVYKVGQPVHITMTETNTTNHAVASPSVKGLQGFTATTDSNVVWESTGGRPAAKSFTLQPGQSHSVSVTWNGRANTGSRSRSTPLTGTFRIDNTLAYNTVTIVIDPRRGKNSNAGVTESIPNESLTLAS